MFENKIPRLFLLIGFFCITIFSCNSTSQKENIDSVKANGNGMRPPVPVIVDLPQVINDSSWKDTSNYVFHISKNKIVVEHASAQNDLDNLNDFNSYVEKNSSLLQNHKVALDAQDKNIPKRIDSVINILKANDIVRFNLITGLEKK